MPRLHYATIVALLSALATSTPAPASESEKERDIRVLLEMTGTLDVGQQMADTFMRQMLESLREARPDIPAATYDALREEVRSTIAENLDGFVEMIVPVYSRHFSAREIKGLLAFYRTELGQKAIRVMPDLVRESMAIGELWGRNLAPEIRRRVMERLQEQGYDLSA
ncbi:MAG: DUF2059 domain-containing protein [Gammaproteobacteria bacterium]|nr:DUF2059 domain-containing protein [Gammaproteobacteria bacterium]NIR85112.1 DUF2059 domain-containing protein [Gammaproteobacteria bacterium]NIR92041.1 DUF2059 domain-containing protein [Gammaproteobacteria bacterium]NIU06161.1 DUF2059 domain-containing protein [Gammaproteobacteria bacterium]NIV53160.1 DUF2059 domain-containing protein [Gammaproteobacteria bacterium]